MHDIWSVFIKRSAAVGSQEGLKVMEESKQQCVSNENQQTTDTQQGHEPPQLARSAWVETETAVSCQGFQLTRCRSSVVKLTCKVRISMWWCVLGDAGPSIRIRMSWIDPPTFYDFFYVTNFISSLLCSFPTFNTEITGTWTERAWNTTSMLRVFL